jgi:hypothetical protein
MPKLKKKIHNAKKAIKRHDFRHDAEVGAEIGNIGGKVLLAGAAAGGPLSPEIAGTGAALITGGKILKDISRSKLLKKKKKK